MSTVSCQDTAILCRYAPRNARTASYGHGARRAATGSRLRTLVASLLGIALVGGATAALSLGRANLPGEMFPSTPAIVSRSFAPRASDPSDWRLVLVNATHPIEPCQPELTQLRDNQAVDSRCYPDLQRMFDDARTAGLRPAINSSWRSRETQQRILDRAVASFVSQGCDEATAREQALRTVALPGTSEHETGLAIDVTSELHTSEGDSAVHAWMADHSWEYGWILRYPAGKEELTGIDNEPWHFRYVGPEAAREMHEYGLCLEEYVG